MALESNIEDPGVYIDSLNDANPAYTDGLSQADDHIRGIKNCVLNTFANITGAVTSTHTELNILDGVTANATELNLLDNATSTNISSSGLNDGVINLVYPVGAIYISTAATNPGTLFGVGTWAQVSRGRTIVGEGTSDATYAAAATGGASTHTLDVTEMPNHNHGGGVHSHTLGDYHYNGGSNSGIASTNVGSTITGYNTDPSSAIITPEGGGVAHNNMPPYLVVYIWERTA